MVSQTASNNHHANAWRARHHSLAAVPITDRNWEPKQLRVGRHVFVKAIYLLKFRTPVAASSYRGYHVKISVSLVFLFSHLPARVQFLPSCANDYEMNAA